MTKQVQDAVAERMAIRAELETLDRARPSGPDDGYESRFSEVVNREEDAVRRLGAAPSSDTFDLLAKIAELGRWRAMPEYADEFTPHSFLDALLDGIISDAERLAAAKS